MDKNNDYKVLSVCMLTYKHERFIEESINSILNQKTNIYFELIISNDCSPDNTDIIINKIINTHPKASQIKYFKHSKNIGMHKNLDFVLKMASGKYIAFCEGDDYWTDINKINKQIDIFNTYDNVGLIHHDANYLFDKTNRIIKDFHKKNKILTSNGRVFHELLIHNNIFTLTVMFKSDLLKYYYQILDKSIFLMPDYVMWLSFSQHTDFYYMPESMATYRVLENSASRSNSFEKEINFLQSYYNIKKYFIEKYNIINLNLDEIENYYKFNKVLIYSKYNMNKEISRIRYELTPRTMNEKFIKYFSVHSFILKIYIHLLNKYITIFK